MLRDNPRFLSHITNLLKSNCNLWQSWTEFILRKNFILSANIRGIAWESTKEAEFTNKLKNRGDMTALYGMPEKRVIKRKL